MAKKSFWETAYEQSAMGSFFGAKKRLDNEDYEDEKEQRYLEGVRNNAVMSGLMSVGQGVNGILNPALQAAEIGDTTMYQYDIDNIAHLGTGPYYDFDQIGGDYANANINMKPIEASDVRGMTTKEKWGSVGTGTLAGAKAGWEVGGWLGALAGGVVGAGGALAGIISGNNKAEREAHNLNNQAEIASSMAQKNFGAAFERVADYQNRKNQANIAKEGGKMSQAARSKHMTIQQFADSVLSKQNADKHSDMIKKHSFSAGGKTYNTHGGYFSPDIIKIDAGGTHEQNPFGGIQLGVDPMGVPNLVEEGEIIYDDYVFSDRLNASESLLKEFALPAKYAGKSFAYIADKLSNEAKERSNDAVSNKGLGAMYDRLMAAQDAHKAKLEEAKLKREMKKMSPEELEAMGQAIAMQAVPPEEQAMQQPEMMPMEQAPVVAAKGGRLAHLYGWGRDADGNLVWIPDDNTSLLNTRFGNGIVFPPVQQQIGPSVVSATPIGKGVVGDYNDYDFEPYNWLADTDTQDEAYMGGLHKVWEDSGEIGINGPNPRTPVYRKDNGKIDPTVQHIRGEFRGQQLLGDYQSSDFVGPTEPPAKQQTQQPAKTSKAPANQSANHYGVEIEKNPHYQQFIDFVKANKDADGVKDWIDKVSDGKGFDWWLKKATDGEPGDIHDATFDKAESWWSRQAPLQAIERPDAFVDSIALKQVPTTRADIDAMLANSPDAPATTSEENIPLLPTWQRYAGAGYNLLTGLHNMLQEPDRYQYRRFNPSYTYGDLALDRVEYNPYDFNLAVNQINASDTATRAQIANSGLGPATGATLLAQNYNAGRNLGNAYFQTQLANQQQKANAIAANNQAAQAEADFDYQRDAANTNIRNQYGLYNLQNAIQTDYLNKQAESQKWQAVSQSLDSAATDLANIGRENFNFNMANTNPALFYGINPYSGRVFYERENVAAEGGKLKKSNWMIDLLDAIDTMHSRRNKDTSNE